MTLQSINSHKNQLRQQTRLLRHALSDIELSKTDQQLAEQFQQHLDQKHYQKIALYLQQDSELGTEHLLDFLFLSGRELYLPKISTDDSHQMQFIKYNKHDALENNRFGIPEPVSDEAISVDDLDLILMPLTAFDLSGNRLGMGGGFYDRALAGCSLNKPLRVGLAYDFQQVQQCPKEDYDQSLQMILTPTKQIKFNEQES